MTFGTGTTSIARDDKPISALEIKVSDEKSQRDTQSTNGAKLSYARKLPDVEINGRTALEIPRGLQSRGISTNHLLRRHDYLHLANMTSFRTRKMASLKKVLPTKPI